MTDQSDFEWIVDNIAAAESMERLEAIAIWIDADKWEKADYATPENLNQLRTLWVKRKKELASG